MSATNDAAVGAGRGSRALGRRLRGWRGHVLLVDALWVAGLLLLSWPIVLGNSHPGSRPVLMLVCAALLAPLAWRRLAPEVVAGVVAGLQVVQVVAGVHYFLPANAFATISAVFSVTAFGRDRVWKACLALAVLSCVLLGVVGVVESGAAGSAGTVVVGAALAGYLRRIVRVRDEAAVERARRLEVERDSAATVAAEQERRRIARDLHDVIAHSLTVIVAQADGARYAAREDPQAAVRSLETVSATARVALRDLRAALGVLRAEGRAETSPLPGAVDLPGLVASVRDSGHAVALTVTGNAAAVPPAAGLTAYRVVQESLTNVLKHAGEGARATVEVHHGAGRTAIRVVDDGLGTAARSRSAASGTGLDGMQERVGALGGAVRAGPREGGGWVVVADVPDAVQDRG